MMDMPNIEREVKEEYVGDSHLLMTFQEQISKSIIETGMYDVGFSSLVYLDSCCYHHTALHFSSSISKLFSHHCDFSEKAFKLHTDTGKCRVWYKVHCTAREQLRRLLNLVASSAA